MNSKLSRLVEAKSQLTSKFLHDELRDIRRECNERGVFASSVHVNAAIRATSDHMEKFSSEAFSDYKRVVLLDKSRFSERYLKQTGKDFLELILKEFEYFDSILSQAVGGIAQSLSNSGLQNYAALEAAKTKTINWLSVELEIFHEDLRSQRLPLGLKVKNFFQNNLLGVILTFLFTSMLTLYKFFLN